MADDLKRTLSQIFGDGKGNYPKGAYLDMMMVHNITSDNDINTIYVGYDKTDPKDERIGALATLIDFRDGTNLTGLNPKEEKLIRHLAEAHHVFPLSLRIFFSEINSSKLIGLFWLSSTISFVR